jgi:hypothetical protein
MCWFAAFWAGEAIWAFENVGAGIDPRLGEASRAAGRLERARSEAQNLKWLLDRAPAWERDGLAEQLRVADMAVGDAQICFEKFAATLRVSKSPNAI